MPDFVDEIEEIIGMTDKLFIRESQPAIPGVYLVIYWVCTFSCKFLNFKVVHNLKFQTLLQILE
jgi:hypothetical protein